MTDSFHKWLHQFDMCLGRWEPRTTVDFWGNDDHYHELVPLEEEEADALLKRYLQEREDDG